MPLLHSWHIQDLISDVRPLWVLDATLSPVRSLLAMSPFSHATFARREIILPATVTLFLDSQRDWLLPTMYVLMRLQIALLIE
jgi:hypothetical protein